MHVLHPQRCRSWVPQFCGIHGQAHTSLLVTPRKIHQCMQVLRTAASFSLLPLSSFAGTAKKLLMPCATSCTTVELTTTCCVNSVTACAYLPSHMLACQLSHDQAVAQAGACAPPLVHGHAFHSAAAVVACAGPPPETCCLPSATDILSIAVLCGPGGPQWY